jgi:hypothetical protein
LAACGPAQTKTVLETQHGIELSLRSERKAPRPAPGPEFGEVNATRVERSLRRVVIRYAKVVSFVRSDPAPLFTEEQIAYLSGAVARELAALPPDQRIGLKFADQYRGDEVDVEIYPEADYLVFEFRSLLLPVDPNRPTPQQRPPNMAVLHPQRDQVFVKGRQPVLKDPFGSAAPPDLKMRDEDEKEEESPL